MCSKIALLFAVLFEPFFFAGISRKNGPLSVQKDYCVLSEGTLEGFMLCGCCGVAVRSVTCHTRVCVVVVVVISDV